MVFLNLNYILIVFKANDINIIGKSNMKTPSIPFSFSSNTFTISNGFTQYIAEN